jgi:hypothetical protein
MSTSNEIEEFISLLYHAFRASRRRYLIRHLCETDDKAFSTRNLARKVASTELNIPEQQATGEPYRNVYNALTQTHLPTLSDAGVIIYDRRRQTVSRGTNFDLAALLLDINTPTVATVTSLISNEDTAGDF